MSYFNIVAATSENTVVTEYIPEQRTANAYQSEAELERDFIRRLGELGYEYLTIHKENDLIENLRKQLETLNSYAFTDSEWKRFFTEYIANANDNVDFASLNLKFIDIHYGWNTSCITSADELYQAEHLYEIGKKEEAKKDS